MVTNRRLTVSVFAATVLLGGATVGLASVPPRPLRSALAVVHTLSFRVATDWLVVVALLAVGDRYVSAGATVDRRLVWRLTAAVFLGGLAIEASPFVRLVVEPASVATDQLAWGLVTAVQRALFPAGLFLATAVGAATVSDGLRGRTARAAPGGLPLEPRGRWIRSIASQAATRSGVALAGVAALSFALDAGARLALGDPHVWLAVVDAGTGALAGLAGHAVLTAAFLVLVVEGVRVRTLVGGTALVWGALFASGVLVAVLSGLVAVALVSLTTTPMGAVEAARLGQWPAPDSWAMLLRLGTFLAGAAGLLAVQRTRSEPRRPADASRRPDDVGNA